MNTSAELPLQSRPAAERVRTLEVEIRSVELQQEQLAAIIQHHRSERPAVADILPEDELVLGWKRQGEKLAAHGQTLKSRLADLRQRMREAKNREREETQLQFERVTAERERIEPELERMETEIRRARELRAKAQARVEEISEHIRQHATLKPCGADYLSESPKANAWRKRQDELLGMRQERIAARDTPKRTCPDPVQALKLADRVQYLKQAQQNLLTKLEGVQPGPQGGVSFVG